MALLFIWTSPLLFSIFAQNIYIFRREAFIYSFCCCFETDRCKIVSLSINVLIAPNVWVFLLKLIWNRDITRNLKHKSKWRGRWARVYKKKQTSTPITYEYRLVQSKYINASAYRFGTVCFTATWGMSRDLINNKSKNQTV